MVAVFSPFVVALGLSVAFRVWAIRQAGDALTYAREHVQALD